MGKQKKRINLPLATYNLPPDSQSAIKNDFIATSRVDERCRGLAPERDFPISGAPRVCEKVFLIGDVREIGSELPDFAPAEIESCPEGNLIEPQVGLGERGEAIAKPVDMKHRSLEQTSGPFRFHQLRAWNFKFDVIVDLFPKLFRRCPAEKMCGDRRKNVASVKCRAHRMSEVLFFGDVKYANRRFPRIDKTKEAIVRSDESILSSVDYDGAPRRPDTGIDDSDVNRSGWKLVITRAQRERRRSYIVRRSFVRDVDNLRFGMNAENDALYGGDEIIRQAEIGEKGDHESGGW